MKNKITSIALLVAVLTASPLAVFADDYTVPVSSYNFYAPYTSSYDYTAPYVSGYNYTAPAVSSYDYTAPMVSGYNYFAPTVSDYNYTAPVVSNYNYVAPTVSDYNYTSPIVSDYNYVAPTVSNYNYVAPTVSDYNYTAPVVSNYNYVAPTVTNTGVSGGYNYVAPTVSNYNYVAPTVSDYNYTAPVVSNYNYSVPSITSSPSNGYSYSVPSITTTPGNNSIAPVTTPNYTTPNYTTPNYTTPSYTYTGTTNTTTVTPINQNPITPITPVPPVITQINCPTGSSLVNGQCINTITGNIVTVVTCPAGTVQNGNNCINNINGTVVTQIVCPNGSSLVNGQCTNTVTGTVITNVICPAGSSLVNGQCLNTVTGTVVTQITCTNGAVLLNGQCVITVTPPVTTVTQCPANTQFINGVCQQIINPPVVVNQTCWDGSVIPATSMCPSQYKVCPNGTNVLVTQVCPITSTPIYIPREVVKFNNVVTSIATQITNTQGRCNGIGLIANGAPSTAWFEYGETPSLGRTTASASIGTSVTAPFSNLLTGLKSQTRYYCRAVMQNQYGIVKGEIVSFVTTKTATSYVKPITTPKKTVTPVKKNEIVCTDGSAVTVKNESAASLISQGEKLISVAIEKASGKLTPNEVVTYKVTYKNLTDTRLTGALIKVTLPQEVFFTSATAGNYDAITRTLILNQDGIDPHAEGTITVTGTVLKDAAIGKTVVTNVYVLYTVPGTKTQDEATAYIIGSIVPATDTSDTATGAKKVVGASEGKGFMPNSLIEWLALLAILFIIFILGRSIYASYKEEGGAHH